MARNAQFNERQYLQGMPGPVGPPGPSGIDGSAGLPDSAAQVLTKLQSVDGAGSGLDADLLDGADLVAFYAGVEAQVDAALAAAGATIPTGTVIAYAGDAETPEPVPGWLLCDGRAVDRVAKQRLFDALGSSHGAGDAATTFNLPDYRGRFLRGVDGGSGRDPDAAGRAASGTFGNTGNAVGTLEADATQAPSSASFSAVSGGSHSHGASMELYISGGSTWLGDGTLIGASPSGTVAYPVTLSSAGGHGHTTSGGDLETRPKNAYVHFLIKD